MNISDVPTARALDKIAKKTLGEYFSVRCDGVDGYSLFCGYACFGTTNKTGMKRLIKQVAISETKKGEIIGDGVNKILDTLLENE